MRIASIDKSQSKMRANPLEASRFHWLFGLTPEGQTPFRIGSKSGILAWTYVLTAAWGAFVVPAACQAHHPDYENRPVRLHVEPIPPWLNNLSSYRERLNRPRYLSGKLLYHIEPTSQEAMAWHRASHRGYYANHAPRMEDRYIYPKPWQVLTVGPRTPVGTMLDEDSNVSSKPSDTIDVIISDEFDANPSPEPKVDTLPSPKY